MKLLPKLINNSTLRISMKGSFAPVTGSLSSDIDVSDSKSLIPCSMPDVFEQAMKIQSYLRNIEDWASVSIGLIQDWRALITLLALSEMKGYKMRFVKVGLKGAIDLFNKRRSLKEEGKLNDSREIVAVNGQLNNINEFLRICSRSIPKADARGFMATNWSAIYVIVYDHDDSNSNSNSNSDSDSHSHSHSDSHSHSHSDSHNKDKDKVVGMCSPLTVACPVNSKEFREIIGNEIFSFVKYDDFIGEYDRYSNFEENCKHILKRQFAGFNKTELKAVLEWVRKVKRECARTVNGAAQEGYALLNNFEEFLLSIHEEDVTFARVLPYADSIFERDSFIEAAKIFGSGFKSINFSAKETRLKREWNALFCVLALKDKFRLQMPVYFEENCVRARIDDHDIIIANSSEHTLIEPVSNIVAVAKLDLVGLGFKENKSGDEYDYSILSDFDRACVIQWLEKLVASDELEGRVQISEYVSDFSTTLRNLNSGNKITVVHTAWGNNRFHCKAPRNRPDEALSLDIFDFSIDYYMAAFFEDHKLDTNDNRIYGDAHKQVRDSWFSLLQILTFSRLSNVKVRYDGTDLTEYEKHECDNTELMYKNNKYDKYKISISGQPVAYTSRKMLFTVEDIDSINRKAREYESFEKMIFIHRLYNLISSLKDNSQYIDANHSDCVMLIELINENITEMKEELKGILPVAEKSLIDDKADEENIFFPLKDDEDSKNYVSTARFISKYVENNLFSKKLLMTKDNNRFNLEIDNIDDHEGHSSIYAIRELDSDNKEKELKRDSNPYGRVFIPITNDAAALLFSKIPRDNFLKGVRRYGFDYIKAIVDEPTKTIKIMLKLNGNSSPFPYIRNYSIASETVDSGNINSFPDVLVWPNVDIEDWNAYFLTIAEDLAKAPGSSGIITISVPDEILTGDGASVCKSDNYSVLDNKKGIDVNYPFTENGNASVEGLNIKSQQLTVFPYFLRVAVGDAYGYIFVPSESSSDKNDCYLTTNSSPESHVVIGVDFGTTNTTAWLSSGPNESAFDARYAESASIIREYVNNMKEIKTAHHIAAQKSPRDLNHDKDTDCDAIINSAMLLYNKKKTSNLQTSMPMPFLHMNIFRMSGSELTTQHGFLNVSKGETVLRHNMKWGDISAASNRDLTNSAQQRFESEREAERMELAAFLMQFTLMCCKVAKEKMHTNSVEFRVSFPSSLSLKKRNMLIEIWEARILNPSIGLETLTGMKIESDIKFFTESYCAGIAQNKDSGFFEATASHETGYLSIDIGGGSTDIALFYKDMEPVAQMSIPFAAQLLLSGDGSKYTLTEIVDSFRILTKTITSGYNAIKNPHIINKYAEYGSKLKGYPKVLEQMSLCKNDPQRKDQFKLLTDVVAAGLYEAYRVIRQAGQLGQFISFNSLVRDLIKKGKRGYLAKIKFGLSALAFFVGTALKKLSETDKPCKTEKIFVLPETLDIYFAGNGARILDWYMYNEENFRILGVTGVRGHEEYAGHVIFSEYIKKGLKKTSNEITINIHINKLNPKQEAAFGLTRATGSSQIDDEAKLDSLAPIGINKGLVEMTLKEFKRHLEECLEKPEFSHIDINEFQSFFDNEDKKGLRDALTRKINPSFFQKHGKTEDVIAFLKTFRSISEMDWKELFGKLKIDIDPDVDIGHANNAAINSKVSADVIKILEYIENPDDRLRNVMPIWDYSPYTILEYAAMVLEGNAGM